MGLNWQGTMNGDTNDDDNKNLEHSTYNLKLYYVQKLFQNSLEKFMEE